MAAGRAAMQLPGADPEGPLGRGLRKLEVALGDDGVVVDLPRTPALDEAIATLTAAVERSERVAVRYWTPSRDEVTERTITPRRLFHDRGEWYVAADDGRSGERRTFRVDRIESMTPTGDLDEPDDLSGDADAAAAAPNWFADGALPRVTLRLRPEATWVAERYPVDSVTELGDGVVEARFPVASERWLERLLVRLGTAAVVVEPDGWRTLGTDAAGARAGALRRVERDEVGLVEHAVRAQQVGEDGGGGACVGERVVGPVDRDGVAGADVGQTVGELPLGVEAARQLHRAEPAVERQLDAAALGRPAEEGGVELGVVGREHGAVEPPAELGQRLGRRRRPAQGAAGEAVQVPRPDAAPRPRQAHEGGPLVADRAVGLDGHDADLQDAMPPAGEPRRLDVDDSEPGQHTVERTQRV